MPASFGTLVDVNVTCLDWSNESRPPGVRRYRAQPSSHPGPAVDVLLCPVDPDQCASPEHLRKSLNQTEDIRNPPGAINLGTMALG